VKRVLGGLGAGLIVWAVLTFLLLLFYLYNFFEPDWLTDSLLVLVAAAVTGYKAKRSGALCGAAIGAVQVLFIFCLVIAMARYDRVAWQNIFTGDFSSPGGYFIPPFPKFRAILVGAVGGFFGQSLTRVRLHGTGVRLMTVIVAVLSLLLGIVACLRGAGGKFDFSLYVFLALGVWMVSAVLAIIDREMRTPEVSKTRSLWGKRPGLRKLGLMLVSFGTVGVVVVHAGYGIWGFDPTAAVLWSNVFTYFLIGGIMVLWISKYPIRIDSRSRGDQDTTLVSNHLIEQKG
jgi:hypothetical protein